MRTICSLESSLIPSRSFGKKKHHPPWLGADFLTTFCAVIKKRLVNEITGGCQALTNPLLSGIFALHINNLRFREAVHHPRAPIYMKLLIIHNSCGGVALSN